jgi:hypothetical protein
MGALSRSLALRRAALAGLWQHLGDCRLAAPRALMQRERDAQLGALLPVLGLIALCAGVLLFPLLAARLGDNHASVLGSLWPLWATQAAPLGVALLIAARRLPALALDMVRRQETGEFAAQARLGVHAATYPGIPWLLASAWTCLAGTSLLVAGSLLLGLFSAFVVHSGDLALAAGIALDTLPPLAWLRALATAWLLGAACTLAGLLVAWPGTASAGVGLDAHRLGVRAMSAGAGAAVIMLVLSNLLFALLGL